MMLLSGLTPAQGFVVCIEADGCVSVEIKATDADCGGCEGHQNEGPSSESGVSTAAGEACPCIDLAVPGPSEAQFARARWIEIQFVHWVAPLPEIRIQFCPPCVTAGRGPPIEIPRVADTLAHIRSVVLLV